MSRKQAQGADLLKNLVRNARDPRQLAEMVRKVGRRVTARIRREDPAASKRWAAEQAVDPVALLRDLDPALWDEAEAYRAGFREEALAILEPIGIDLGGGGDYRLLHFLVRLLRPEVVVETGVAAGYSSASVLSAMAANGSGHLWSSDFPYFRLDDPAKYIGVLVSEDLRSRWTLHIKGDRTNLPRIVDECGTIDIFHYDSDKSVEGRTYGLEQVKSLLSPSAVIVFDDIQDNFHFRDHVAASGRKAHVLKFGGKYVGIIALGGPVAEHLA